MPKLLAPAKPKFIVLTIIFTFGYFPSITALGFSSDPLSTTIISIFGYVILSREFNKARVSSILLKFMVIIETRGYSCNIHRYIRHHWEFFITSSSDTFLVFSVVKKSLLDFLIFNKASTWFTMK